MSLLALEYQTLVAEWREAVATLGDWRSDPAKAKEYSRLTMQFEDGRFALAKRYCVPLDNLDYPAELKPLEDTARAVGDKVIASIYAAGYWFRKLEDRELTKSALREYFAASRGWGQQRIDHLTIPELAVLLKQDYEEREGIGETKREPTAILSLGERQYRVGNALPVTLEENEDSVLQAFLEQASMNGPTLISKAGFDDAPRVLRNLRKKYGGIFSANITLPSKKGQGGYRVAIRRNLPQ